MASDKHLVLSAILGSGKSSFLQVNLTTASFIVTVFETIVKIGVLVDMGKEQAKRVIRNEKKDTTILPLCWTADSNTLVSDQD
ncbi:unnamed protein product [Ilex paraguariensis]|uniref:Uncharacterized protein n=1 Tax=Ilex paraguariensis TaxID=185542 RepID=A0ABC8TM92_9AQUA